MADEHQPTASPQSHGRYEHIDAMRSFAVSVVVVAHAGLGDIVPGGSGVTIFFAISGFIITHLLLGERKKTGGFNLKGFYVRRLFKLTAPFMLIVALPTVIYSFWHEVNWSAFLSQVFFTFNWAYMKYGDAQLLPGSGVVWSLSIEEQFYIVFAIFWIFACRSQRYLAWLTGLATVGVIVPLLLRLWLGVGGVVHERSYYGTDTRLDGIAMGVLAAVLYFQLPPEGAPSKLRAVLSSDWILFGSLGLYLTSLAIRQEFFRETFRYSMQSAAGAAVLLYGLMSGTSAVRRLFHRVAGLRILQVIGLSSYSIYLVHFEFDRFFTTQFPKLAPAISIPIQIVVGMGVGIAFWAIVERPIEKLKKKYSAARAAPALTAVP